MPAKARRPPVWLPALQWAVVLVLGALLGSGLAVLGEQVLPQGPLISPLVRTWEVGVDPPARGDLLVLSLSVGATLRVGALTVAGALGAGLLLARVRR